MAGEESESLSPNSTPDEIDKREEQQNLPQDENQDDGPNRPTTSTDVRSGNMNDDGRRNIPAFVLRFSDRDRNLGSRWTRYVPSAYTSTPSARLASLLFFPHGHRLHLRLLAHNGIRFCGFRDYVSCDFCGRVTQNWADQDDLSSVQWHETTCRNYFSSLRYDVLSDSRYRREGTQSSRSTSRDESTGHPTPGVIPEAARTSVFDFSSSSGSDTELFSTVSRSSSRTSLKDRSFLPRDSHSSAGRSFRSDHNHVVDRPSPEEVHIVPAEPPDNSHQALQVSPARRFPCQYPVYRRFRRRNARLKTFKRWRAHRDAPSVRSIAEAGFYFCGGEGDVTKCFYCGVVMRNWKKSNNPWVEHAILYPDCEFLNREKGPTFVQNVQGSAPNQALGRNGPGDPGPSGVNAPILSPYPRSTDSEGDSRFAEVGHVDAAMDCEVVSKAKDMGFKKHKIRKAVARRWEKQRQRFNMVEDLLEEISSDTASSSGTDPETTEPNVALFDEKPSRLTLTLRISREEFSVFEEAKKNNWSEHCLHEAFFKFLDMLFKLFQRHPHVCNDIGDVHVLRFLFIVNFQRVGARFFRLITDANGIPAFPISQAGYFSAAFYVIFLPEIEFRLFLHKIPQCPQLFSTICCMLSPRNRPCLNNLASISSQLSLHQRSDRDDFIADRFYIVQEWIATMVTGNHAAVPFFCDCSVLLTSNPRIFLPCPCERCRFRV